MGRSTVYRVLSSTGILLNQDVLKKIRAYEIGKIILQSGTTFAVNIVCLQQAHIVCAVTCTVYESVLYMDKIGHSQ